MTDVSGDSPIFHGRSNHPRSITERSRASERDASERGGYASRHIVAAAGAVQHQRAGRGWARPRARSGSAGHAAVRHPRQPAQGRSCSTRARRWGRWTPSFRGSARRSRTFGLAVVRQFEMMGVYCLNESQAIARSRDKLRSLQLLSRHDIGLPPTVYTRQARAHPRLRRAGGRPAGGGEAAARDAGRRRGAGREHDGGQLGDRGVPRPGAGHPDPEVHPRGQRGRHPRPGGGRQGGGGDEAAGAGGRVPLEHAPRRQGEEDPPVAGVSAHGGRPRRASWG